MVEWKVDRGATLLTWSFAEYMQHERGRSWYVAAASVAILLLVYAFVTRNFLFAVIIVMLGVVIFLQHTRTPQHLTCALTERGIACDTRFFPYEDLEEFWIADREHHPPVLYTNPRGLRPRVAIPLSDAKADQVQAILRAHVPEREEKDEPASDAIVRMLKL